MTNLAQFRLELERQLHIHRWQPTDAQLQVIASVIKQRSVILDLNVAEILGIVQTYAKVDDFFIMEGVDNSDLETLLLLATKVG
jgi:hypothetical protein